MKKNRSENKKKQKKKNKMCIKKLKECVYLWNMHYYLIRVDKKWYNEKK
jgi:hypothetical protein